MLICARKPWKINKNCTDCDQWFGRTVERDIFELRKMFYNSKVQCWGVGVHEINEDKMTNCTQCILVRLS